MRWGSVVLNTARASMLHRYLLLSCSYVMLVQQVVAPLVVLCSTTSDTSTSAAYHLYMPNSLQRNVVSSLITINMCVAVCCTH